jgi:hypothetical protein
VATAMKAGLRPRFYSTAGDSTFIRPTRTPEASKKWHVHFSSNFRSMRNTVSSRSKLEYRVTGDVHGDNGYAQAYELLNRPQNIAKRMLERRAIYGYQRYRPAFAICACISTACSTRICYN